MARTKTVKTEHQKAMRECFLGALVQFLVGDQASKSIHLDMGKPWAKEWSRLRGCTPIQGWASEEETRAVLKKFLGW